MADTSDKPKNRSYRFVRAYRAAYEHFARGHGSCLAFHAAMDRYRKKGYLDGVAPCNVTLPNGSYCHTHKVRFDSRFPCPQCYQTEPEDVRQYDECPHPSIEVCTCE